MCETWKDHEGSDRPNSSYVWGWQLRQGLAAVPFTMGPELHGFKTHKFKVKLAVGGQYEDTLGPVHTFMRSTSSVITLDSITLFSVIFSFTPETNPTGKFNAIDCPNQINSPPLLILPPHQGDTRGMRGAPPFIPPIPPRDLSLMTTSSAEDTSRSEISPLGVNYRQSSFLTFDGRVDVEPINSRSAPNAV